MKLRIEIDIFSNWYTSSKSIRKIDLDNFSKVTLDALAELLNFDDSQVFELILKKRDGQAQTIIYLYEISESVVISVVA